MKRKMMLLGFSLALSFLTSPIVTEAKQWTKKVPEELSNRVWVSPRTSIRSGSDLTETKNALGIWPNIMAFDYSDQHEVFYSKIVRYQKSTNPYRLKAYVPATKTWYYLKVKRNEAGVTAQFYGTKHVGGKFIHKLGLLRSMK